MVCPRAISPNYQPAPKDAGFHVVQASLLLTRHLPLKEALVLLTTIPKESSHNYKADSINFTISLTGYLTFQKNYNVKIN